MFTDLRLRNARRLQDRNDAIRATKTLMDDARVNNFQYSQLTTNMLRGASLSSSNENPSIKSQTPINKPIKPVRPSNIVQHAGLRSYHDIVNSGAYSPPEYHPKPMKMHAELEKDRLAFLMAYGTDPTKAVYKSLEIPPPRHETDRFDELVLEVEQRKQFLNEMTMLGKRKEYEQVILNEISDKVREMEQIDRQRSKALESRLKELRN